LTAKGTTKTLTGTRYYTANGQTIAVRTAVSGTSGTKLTFLAADHHGTSSIALDSVTYAVTKRYSTPFGGPRGTKAGNWPDDKAFLGKPADESTGLTHVGAREYDPGTGQFISVDPVLAVEDAQSLNGYSYANNTPVTSSDPTGLCMYADCPTRPSPGEQNTTPGHKPGKRKDSANTSYAKQGLSYNGGGTSHTSSSGNTSSGGDSWLPDFIEGPVDTVVNYGTAIVTTPDIWWGAGETALGVFMMGVGGTEDFLGGAVCVTTGAGCVIGIPAVAQGTGLIVGGGFTAGDGVSRFNDGIGTALREAKAAESSGSSGSATPSWIPEKASSKVPESLGEGKATKKGVGWRWNDGKGNGVRIDKGNLNNSQEYQQVDHVVINSGGRIIGRDGEPVSGDIKSNAYQSHIPLSEWVKWKSWNSPN
ncbi:RHS repeat-associated core domain-containing protein, partial [Streptomyces sp. NPDC008313]|uniref:RHS repeat-associated core domain-containing protein n=1 Tax=Streptomyces sp. NPDC008313 TaxID=3364826 RepID=UPI0036F133C9